jgi:hypothetical protein
LDQAHIDQRCATYSVTAAVKSKMSRASRSSNSGIDIALGMVRRIDDIPYLFPQHVEELAPDAIRRPRAAIADYLRDPSFRGGPLMLRPHVQESAALGGASA